jgi:hypothetical protein
VARRRGELDQLLGQGRCTGSGEGREELGKRRPGEGDRIDAAMGVEAAILSGEQGKAEVAGELLWAEGRGGTEGIVEGVIEGGAVAGEDVR